ncbi:hypothetical protein IJQ19_03605 [bacterium]|nr:hypothetical protein [bacterium]
MNRAGTLNLIKVAVLIATGVAIKIAKPEVKIVITKGNQILALLVVKSYFSVKNISLNLYVLKPGIEAIITKTTNKANSKEKLKAMILQKFFAILSAKCFLVIMLFQIILYSSGTAP